MDCSRPGSQTRMLEWVAISFSRGSSRPRDWTHISCWAGEFLTTKLRGKPIYMYIYVVVQLLSHVWLFAIPWTAAHQASPSCVCIYIYIYIHTHTHTHTHIYIYMLKYIDTYIESWQNFFANPILNLPLPNFDYSAKLFRWNRSHTQPVCENFQGKVTRRSWMVVLILNMQRQPRVES